MTPDPTHISEDDLLSDIATLADDLGRAPTSSEYARQGTHSDSTVHKRYDSWVDALRAADVDVSTYDPNRTRDKYALDDVNPEDLGLSPMGERPES